MREHRKPSAEILHCLATNLKTLRKNRGYTQVELAKLANVHETYVGDVEQETVNITLANLEALASGLRCLAVDLLMPIRATPPDRTRRHDDDREPQTEF
jgi:XRE family transcriptional regulator, regulator of sulfur utilization